MAHIVVEAAALTADMSHTPDIVGKPARSHRGCPHVAFRTAVADLSAVCGQHWRLGTLATLSLCSPESKAWLRRAEHRAAGPAGRGEAHGLYSESLLGVLCPAAASPDCFFPGPSGTFAIFLPPPVLLPNPWLALKGQVGGARDTLAAPALS